MVTSIWKRNLITLPMPLSFRHSFIITEACHIEESKRKISLSEGFWKGHGGRETGKSNSRIQIVPKENQRSHYFLGNRSLGSRAPLQGGGGGGEDVGYRIYAKTLTQIKKGNIKYFFRMQMTKSADGGP